MDAAPSEDAVSNWGVRQFPSDVHVASMPLRLAFPLPITLSNNEQPRYRSCLNVSSIMSPIYC